jgi:hypothetical protein
MRQFILIVLAILLFFGLTNSWAQCGSASPVGGRALSLKVLQQRLEPYHSTGNYPEELSQLVGITRLMGYVVDEANQDIILFGKADTSAPPLHLEDFIIALNNARHTYAKRNANTIYYSYPGCSIDPDSRVINTLQNLQGRIMGGGSESDVEDILQQWNDICSSPQKVRVIGIPFHTRFAKIMVKADYDMKRLADGSDSLGLPGFASLVDMTLEKAGNDLRKGKSISIPISSMERFWFYPGENRYLEAEGIVGIQECPVILLTEAEYLNKEGKITGSGRAHILAHQFAQNFSAHYQEVAQLRPIYKELESLFRMVALAKIIVFKSPHVVADFDLDTFCDSYRVPQTPVDEQLPGRHNVKRFTHRQDFEGGYQIAQLWLPSCGGVNIEIIVSHNRFRSDPTPALPIQKQETINLRPNEEELCWEIPLMWQAEDERIRMELDKYAYTKKTN